MKNLIDDANFIVLQEDIRNKFQNKFIETMKVKPKAPKGILADYSETLRIFNIYLENIENEEQIERLINELKYAIIKDIEFRQLFK